MKKGKSEKVVMIIKKKGRADEVQVQPVRSGNTVPTPKQHIVRPVVRISPKTPRLI